MINPGRFRESITVQSRDVGSGGSHDSPTAAESWSDAFTDRAEVKLDNRRTDVVAGRDTPRLRGTFLVRNRSGYTHDRRIVWNGMIFEIEETRHKDAQRRLLEIATVYTGDAP